MERPVEILQFAQFISGRVYQENRVLRVFPIMRPSRIKIDRIPHCLWKTQVKNLASAVHNCRFCTGFFTFIHSIPTLIPKSYSHYPQGFPQAFLWIMNKHLCSHIKNAEAQKVSVYCNYVVFLLIIAENRAVWTEKRFVFPFPAVALRWLSGISVLNSCRIAVIHIFHRCGDFPSQAVDNCVECPKGKGSWVL